MKFVFDLDGTICFEGQPLTENLLSSLEELTKEGYDVIFASARPIRDMLPVINKKFHHYTMIVGNGSLISKEGKVIHSQAFSPQEIKDIKDLIQEFKVTYLIDSEWDYAYTGPNNHPILQNLDPARLAKLVSLENLTSIVKILFLTSESTEQLENRLSSLDISINIHSNEKVFDISPKGISKWSALRHLGIQKDSYIAFGNDANDISMFENALYTVMIGHHDQLSQFAKETISLDSDYEDKIILKLNELSQKFNL